MKFSLSTREPKTALMIARILVHIGVQINRQGIALNMRYDDIRGVLTRHFQEMLQREKDRINVEGRLTSEQYIDYQRKLEDTQGAINHNGTWLGESDNRVLVDAFMKKHSLNFAPESDQYAWLQRDLKNAYRSYIKSVLAYDQSLDDFDFQTLSTVATNPSSANRLAAVSLGELTKNFLHERNAGGVWAERTKIEKQDHMDLLLEIIPRETDVAHINAAHAAEVKTTLMSLPKNWRKLPETRNLSIRDALKVEGLDRLKPPSINKYLQTYADFFGWITNNGHTERNIFAGLSIKFDSTRVGQDRKPFTDTQIIRIIDYTFHNAVLNTRKEYQRWAPLLGAYTGARLNEIAQLEVNDLKQENGIWFFDISDEGESKSLKTKASRRKIPIHSKLQSTGLLEFIGELKARGVKYVFHELSYSPEHGRGRNIGRWFNEKLLKALDMDDPAYVFHSFRHTVNTKLARASVADPLIKAILGHTQVGMTYSTYFGEGFELRQLADAIECLSYAPQKPADAIF